MSDDIRAFVRLLRALDEAGLLLNVLIIGTWCQVVYRAHFDNPPELSQLRTFDVDFLIPQPLRISHPQDLHLLMSKLGYKADTALDGSTHFLSKDIDVEFLVPEVGRGSDASLHVDALGINVQRLRLLDRLQARPLTVLFEGLSVRVPDPIDYAYHKLLVSMRRRDKDKVQKDIMTGKQLLLFLSTHSSWREWITPRFEALSRNARANLLNLARKSLPELLPLVSPERHAHDVGDLDP